MASTKSIWPYVTWKNWNAKWSKFYYYPYVDPEKALSHCRRLDRHPQVLMLPMKEHVYICDYCLSRRDPDSKLLPKISPEEETWIKMSRNYE